MQHLARLISELDRCSSEETAVSAACLSAQGQLPMLSRIKLHAHLSNSAGLSCMCRMVSRL